MKIMKIGRFGSSASPGWKAKRMPAKPSGSIGVSGRGAYFEESGIIRDMIQNHLLQLLTLIAMEPPVSLAANAVRDEKVKVLHSIRSLSPEDVAANPRSFTGQYLAGMLGKGREAAE